MPINADLAQLGDQLIYSAIVVYALAMFALSAEWAFGRVGVGSASAQDPAAGAAKAPDTARAAGQTAEQPRQAVSASVGAQGADHASVGGRAAERDPAATPGGWSPPGDPSPGRDRAERIGRVGMSLTVLAFGLHLAGLTARGGAEGRVPWSNMYEFSTTSALAAIGVFLVLAHRYDVRWLGVFVVGPVLLTLGLAVTVLYAESAQLQPALQSYWLVIHVVAMATCGGAFTVGAALSVLFMLRSRSEAPGAAPTRLWRLPPAAALDRLAYKVHAFAFPLWTFGVIAGAIWAENAWNRYWGWDPKETWAFITWVVYAAYLHARATAGWRGHRVAVIALVGFGAFLFDYFVINLMVSGLHSYAGL